MPQQFGSAGVVVVGAGHAASELVGSLRTYGYSERILVLGEEHHLPYQRPPLSKAFLSGDLDLPGLELKPESSYRSIRVEIRTGIRVESINRRTKELHLSNGETETYEKLVLATGGRPRQLSLPEIGPIYASNLHYLRTAHDAQRLRPQLKPGIRLVIIGGGYIGLEVAAIARQLALHVTVLEAHSRILARVTAPEVSSFYDNVHRSAGVDIRTGIEIQSVQIDVSRDTIGSITLASGELIPADLVLAGIGLIPNVELAERAGIDVDNGILVNEFAETSDPAILAVGDCSNHPSNLYGRRVRIESVPNAVGQARAAAATLSGSPKPYDIVPWFWSDQYDLKLQIVGLCQSFDNLVVRGVPESRSFIAFYLQADRIIAADAINRPKEFMLAKRMVSNQMTLTSFAELADDAQPLQAFIKTDTNHAKDRIHRA